jgi:hypothetical protein
LATITVVAPAVVYPGADSFFAQFTEKNSVSVAARRLVVLDSTPEWLAVASDGALILGTNQVAGANITSGKSATDVMVFVPATMIEINSNATGTDPIIGTAYGVVVSTNDHQLDQSDTSNDRFVVIRKSPRDTAGDTNIRVYAKVLPTALQFTTGL